MIVIKCDRCGETIKELKDSDEVQDAKMGKKGVQMDFMFNGQFIQADLCESCKQKLAEWLTENPAKKKAAEKTKATEKAKSGRSQLDDKKIANLRKGGWTLDIIAREMKCSAQTVANHLKAMGMS